MDANASLPAEAEEKKEKIISYSSEEARQERLEEAANLPRTLRVLSWQRPRYDQELVGQRLVIADTERGELMCEELSGGLEEIEMEKVLELLVLAEKRAQEGLAQNQKDLATCGKIRERLEEIREKNPRRKSFAPSPGPFAEILKKMRE